MKKLLLAMLLISSMAYAYEAYLVSSRVDGAWRYCQYSDGRVISIQAWQMCPQRLQ